MPPVIINPIPLPAPVVLSHTRQTWHITSGVTGTRTAEYLRPFSAFYRGGEEAHIYLTFELAYEPGYTGDVLDVLLAWGVSAAFFVTLPYMDNNDDLLLRMTAEGHVVGLLPQQALTGLSEEEIGDAVLYPPRFFSENFGRPMDPFLRPAEGLFSEHTLGLTRHYGFFTVFWSAAQADFTQNTPVHPGMILSLQGINEQTANGLARFIGDMGDAGYVFSSLYNLI
jgi:peptidoglycan-N-acetylmuramic acid deacetylase